MSVGHCGCTLGVAHGVRGDACRAAVGVMAGHSEVACVSSRAAACTQAHAQVVCVACGPHDADEVACSC